MKKLLLIAGLAALLLTSCSGALAEPTAVPEPTATCEEMTVEYRAAVDAVLTTWDDANAIAGSTARMNLSGPVGDLQEIAREIEALDVPPCAEEAHELLTRYMRRVIDGFLAFMADEPNAANMLNQADRILEDWAEEYTLLTTK